MSFTQNLWEQVKPIYKKILEHPFIKELGTGTLDINIFKYYIEQDSLYLVDYARALSVLSAKSGNIEYILQFSQFAADTIIVERSLHDTYFKKYNLHLPREQNPACFMYTRYLLSTCSLQNIETGVAALLPCFWVYREVSSHILNIAGKDNPFIDWIRAYSTGKFAASTDIMLQITETIAAGASETVKNKMIEAFIMATRLEYLFWDGNYKRENWMI
ncbi:MAG TPA: thiaminase II [Bacteroidetes bacterium]|nr:thiaminase II [Bacteroidota bacterium]